jgi:hypothetical protein
MAANMYGLDVEDCFLDHDEVLKMMEAAETTAAWDFNTALGDTIREKYESLYIKLVEVTNVMIKKGAAGLFWVAVSPELGTVLEVATYNYYIMKCDEQIELGTKKVYKQGIMQRKWTVYVDPSLEPSQMLVGCGEHKLHENDGKNYARMTVTNLVI